MNKQLIPSIHALERWLQRVIDPTRYSHLDTCKNIPCGICVTLIHNIRNIVKNNRGMIEKQIQEGFKNSVLLNGERYKTFLKEKDDLNPNQKMLFRENNNIIFVLSEKGDCFVVASILTKNMFEQKHKYDTLKTWKSKTRIYSQNIGRVPNL